MLEIEVKYHVPDLAPVREQLVNWGATVDDMRCDVDQYFNAPDRDFARTDEAMRVRRIGSDNFVTYKGPKIEAPTKTRTEIEVPLASGEEAAQQFAQILTHLGYRAVAIVRKKRIVCHLERGGFTLEACLDDVENVGLFVELEIMDDEAHLPAARGVVLETAAALGLTQLERRSYLEMLLTPSRTT